MKRFTFCKIIASRTVEETGWMQEGWLVIPGTKKEAKVVAMGWRRWVKMERDF